MQYAPWLYFFKDKHIIEYGRVFWHQRNSRTADKVRQRGKKKKAQDNPFGLSCAKHYGVDFRRVSTVGFETLLRFVDLVQCAHGGRRVFTIYPPDTFRKSGRDNGSARDYFQVGVSFAYYLYNVRHIRSGRSHQRGQTQNAGIISG